MNAKKVISTIENNIGELFIYGILGQEFFYYEDKGEETLTDVEILRTLRKMESAGVTQLFVHINSPGGFERHTTPIVNLLKSSKMEFYCVCDGIAASGASDIFFAAKKENRSMYRNSKLMIHGPWDHASGDYRVFLQKAEELKKFEESTVSQLAYDMAISEEEVAAKYFDGKDHWITAKDALEAGLISTIIDQDAEGVPSGIEKMAMVDIVKLFKSNDKNSIQELISAGIASAMKALGFKSNNIIKSTPEMNAEEFKKSLGTELPEDIVVKTLQELGYEVKMKVVVPAAATDSKYSSEEVKKMIDAEVGPLKEQIEKFAAKPATKPAAIAVSADNQEDPATMTEVEKKVQNTNKVFEEKAANGDSFRITT